MQTVLVTGGAGFIGSYSVDLLLEEGYRVLVLDNLSSGKLPNLNLKSPHLEFIEGDILDYPLVEKLVYRSDAVLHLAAIPSVLKSIQEPVYCFQVNMQGFLHVLTAVQKSSRMMPFVYASSAAIYGDAKELPCRDDQPLSTKPLSPYGLQKMNNENYAHLYDRLYGIKSIGLRYFNVYGERQDPKSPYSGVISLFLDAYHKQKKLIVYGDGTQSRDFIHVSDVARANLLALKTKNDSTSAVNIATGKGQTLLRLINCIEAAGEKKAQIHYADDRDGDIKHSYATVQIAENLFGFKSTVDLEEGMRKMVLGE